MLHEPSTSLRRPWLALLLGVAVLAAWLTLGPTALAQTEDPFFSEPAASSGQVLSWNNWVIRAIVLAFAVVVTAVFCFVVVFQVLLRDSRWWPRSAYGFSLGMTILLTALLAVVIFWDKLALQGESVTWLNRWGPRTGILLAGTVLCLIVLYGFRSDKRGAAAQA